MADGMSPPTWPDPGDPGPAPAVVDCDGCAVRGLACDDCVVTVLLGPISGRPGWDGDDLSALDALADAGLVPPLRLVQAPPTRPVDQPAPADVAPDLAVDGSAQSDGPNRDCARADDHPM